MDYLTVNYTLQKDNEDQEEEIEDHIETLVDSPSQRRETLENYHISRKFAKRKGQYYKKAAIFDLEPKVP